MSDDDYDDSWVKRVAWWHLVAVGVTIGGHLFWRVRKWSKWRKAVLEWRPCVVDYGAGPGLVGVGVGHQVEGVDVCLKACEGAVGEWSPIEVHCI